MSISIMTKTGPDLVPVQSVGGGKSGYIKPDQHAGRRQAGQG